jgi:crossover junction endodeoxyribonuclease RusA
MVAFKLPWPEACLAQNSRGHWAVSAPRKKKARAVAKRVCSTALLNGKLHRDTMLSVILTFHPPELKRRRDLQNLIGAMKYAVDGIADAVGIDDSQFELSFGWGPVLDKDGYVGVVLS